MRRTLPALALLAVTAGCASAPGPASVGTPAEPVARQSYAAVVIGAPPLPGAHRGALRWGAPGGLGSAVAIDSRHVLTNSHVMRLAGMAVERATLVRDDGRRAEAALVGRSEAMDLAVLRMPEGFLSPARAALAGPLPAQPVWAAGTTTVGPGLAKGWVMEHDTAIDGLGEGFIARMGALMGYSGGPVVGPDGAVLGLTTALVSPGAAPLLGMLTGADVDGLLSAEGREVFVLGIGPALDEARRLIAASARVAEASRR
jgi:S1-C subfamily serine protease